MILTLLHRFTYVGMLVLLVAAGLGIPIPEDLTLITAGYLARRGVTSLWPTLVVGYVGVVLGDLLIFRLGRRLQHRVYTHPRFARLFTPKRRRWIEEHFQKRGVLTVVIARHVAGLRAPTFLVAGTSGMPTWKFCLADAFSSLLTVPAVTYLGYFFGQNLHLAHRHVHRIQFWVLVGLVLFGLALFLYHAVQRRQLRRQVPPDISTARSPGAP